LAETEHILEMTEYLRAKGWYFCGGNERYDSQYLKLTQILFIIKNPQK
jgi:hypothetical protein